MTPLAARSKPSMSLDRRGIFSALPLVVLLLYAGALAHPSSRAIAVEMVQENRPVELLTFLFLCLAGLLGLRLAHRLRSSGRELPVWGFHAAFGLGMLVVGMEEVAWGQHFLGFETPEALERVNQQGEVTLHNIGPLQGRSEVFRLAFGAAGLLGIWLSFRPRWREVGVPPSLWAWFAVIAAAAVIDLHNDYFPAGTGFYDEGWRWLSEVVEMLIGAAALLYVGLKERLLPPSGSRR